MIIFHMINKDFQKVKTPGATFFDSSLVSFFNLLLSKYVLKILANPPSELTKHVSNVLKVGFLS